MLATIGYGPSAVIPASTSMFRVPSHHLRKTSGDLPVRRALISSTGGRIVIVSVHTTVSRRVVIHDGILRHDPPKPADGVADILRNGASPLAERVNRTSL